MAVDEMFLENLDEFINDENKIVTYKWLSRTISVHVNQAKQMLYSFVDQQRNKKDNDNLCVMYLVAGLTKTAEDVKVHKVLIVPEEQLDTVKHSLSQVTSCHIYSVQKTKLKNTDALYQADYDLLKEQISNPNKFSAITCTTAKRRSPVDLEQSQPQHQEQTNKPVHQNGTSHTKNEASSGKPVKAAGGIAGMMAAASNKAKLKASSGQEDGNRADTKTENVKPKTEQKNANKNNKTSKQGGLSSFFGKQASKSSTKTETSKLPSPKKEVKSETNNDTKDRNTDTALPITSGSKKKVIRSSDEEDPMPQQKRRRIQDKVWESSSDEDEKMEEDEDPIPPSPPPPNSRLPEPDLETFVSDKEKTEIVSEETSNKTDEVVQSGGKRRKRTKKLVAKTSIDGDGFMVTEKVWECESTDASDTDEVKKPAAVSPAKTQQKANQKKTSPAKKQSPPKGNAKQASLMSFFKKK